MLVADASVLVLAVADATEEGDPFRARMRGEVVCGPDLLRVEVVSALRRMTAAARLTRPQANAAIDDLLELPLSVFPTAPLLRRAWELRANLSTYDACYVALAEALDCTLVTADGRLARATGPRCSIELL